MGALNSIIRKRGDDHGKSLVSISPPIDQSYGHISKKPKLSVFTNKSTPEYNWSYSVVSKISLYPDSKPRFSREVHAPVRHSRVGSFSHTKKVEGSASFEENSAGKMGNCLGIQFPYDKVKNGAIKSLKFFWKDNDSFVGKDEEKLVIEIDDTDEENRGDVSDDSSIEEIKIVDVSGSKWKEGHRSVVNSQDQKFKMVEKDLLSLDSSVVTDISNANEKLDGVEKMMEVMLLDQEPDAFGVPAHKKLYDFTKRRDGKLNSLDLEIEYNEKCLQRFQLLWSEKKGEQIKKDVVEECFVPLTEEEEALVARAWSNSNRRKVLARYYVDEVKDKSGKYINVSSWEEEFVTNLPEQENGFDCGMFMIKYADFYSRDIGLCFNQGHMPYFRRRTAKEILKLRAE